MKSACLKPSSMSPWPYWLRLATLDGLLGFCSTPSVKMVSLSTGAEGFIASSTSVTCGSTS